MIAEILDRRFVLSMTVTVSPRATVFGILAAKPTSTSSAAGGGVWSSAAPGAAC